MIDSEHSLPKELQEMASVQQEHEEKLLGFDNVLGVGLGHKEKGGKDTGEPVISVLVEQKIDDPSLLSGSSRVPKKLKGITTDVIEVGSVFAGDASDDEGYSTEDDSMPVAQAAPFSPALRRRVRPVMGGYSIGHYRITAGTMATACYDLQLSPGKPSAYYILSNNHVLANSNNARPGDPILQPGRYDGGKFPQDDIARLKRFVPIKFHQGNSAPCNYVDAAIAEGNFEDLRREIYWAGHVEKLYCPVKVGDTVKKTGRTTGFTTGKVTHINATLNVNFGGGKVAKFCRQNITTDMSAPGDSGSLIMNLDNCAVGLLFAGSATRTIFNNIAYVQSLLGIRLAEK